MLRTNYEELQAKLSGLPDKARLKGVRGERKEGYELAVRACKSVVSNYKPNCEGKPMSEMEYEEVQARLSDLLGKARLKGVRGKSKEGYELAVLACKSVVSNYKPN